MSFDHPLVSLDTESTEVVQEASRPLFSLPPRILRTSRTSTVLCPPYAPQTLPTGSASYAISPRYSRSPFSGGSPGRRTRVLCVYASAIRCIGSKCYGGLVTAHRSDTSVDSMSHSRTASTRELRFLTSRSSTQGEHSVGRTV